MKSPLSRPLRSQLEKTVMQARAAAEAGARAALIHLGVGDPQAPAHLDAGWQDLRRRLRARGRQLGDERQPSTGRQAIDFLAEEIAYEHWHRMLFARFLAENGLLMWDDGSGTLVPVTLEECAQLAPAFGFPDGWELAARAAQRLLPQIFRPDSPAFEVALPPERQAELERLAGDLPAELFTASDSLGWVYQYWQAARKDAVNRAEARVGARELPAVTQLFTEPYMVAFLIDNTLGAWWAARCLSDAGCENAAGEEELRARAALPGWELSHLRLVRDEDGRWRPAAGTFDEWPADPAQWRILDPCCGSGHFLVALLHALVPLRMRLEGLSERAAVDAVLSQNLHGLELDARCVELAAFSLALSAWTYPDGNGNPIGYRPLPALQVACSGLPVGSERGMWEQLTKSHNLRIALRWLYEVFADAPLLGSLIDPVRAAHELGTWADLEKLLAQALSGDASGGDDDLQESAVAARGLAAAARLLAQDYHLILTNVPYLARGKQSEKLRQYCERHHGRAKADLATVFLDRLLALLAPGGATGVVMPQNWLFLQSYKAFRKELLENRSWRLVARLGPGAFEAISGEVVNAILLVLGETAPRLREGELFAAAGAPDAFAALDVSDLRPASAKAEKLRTAEIHRLSQSRQLQNPDHRVTLEEGDNLQLLEKYAYAYQGISPADFPRYGRCFWEMNSNNSEDWQFWQSTVNAFQYFGGREHIIWMKEVLKKVKEEGKAYIRGIDSWGKTGVIVSAMRELPSTISSGFPTDTNVAVIVPHDPAHLPALWCYCSSPEYAKAVRRIDQKLNVTNATLVKVPFDLDFWMEEARRRYPSGLPRPFSGDPTQWIFHGHPCGSVIWDENARTTAHGPLRGDESVLQVAVARLVGYRWPAERDPDMDLAPEQREWVRRCTDLHRHADDDGIVCIPPVRGEKPAADRLLSLLADAYGKDWHPGRLSALLSASGGAGRSLEEWLRDVFFARHCRMFHQRPFVWQIWDGLRDGFSALVLYHKLDRRGLERLIHTYLGDWIVRCQQDEKEKVPGAAERLAAARTLAKRLELVLEGEAPYDVFVRWKPIEEQPLGWDPDFDDGVRLNIRPFLRVPDVGKKGAGVLRERPGIDWGKDRGKDTESSPWYGLFKGERINDHHLTLAEKRAAREQEKRR